MSQTALIVYQSHAGDRNNLGKLGALSIVQELSRRLNQPFTTIGKIEPFIGANWDVELSHASVAFQKLSEHFDAIFSQGQRSLSALSRCATSIATLPILMKYHPNVCVIWFDAHADLNAPSTSESGYLGGMALLASLGMWSSGFGDGLKFSNIILVGQRDMDACEVDVINAHRIQLIHPNTQNLYAELKQAIANRPVYVHLDCDVLNPYVVPTEYTSEGGLSLDELKLASMAIAEHEIIGLEIAEFQYAWSEGEEAFSPAPLIDALQPIIERLHPKSTSC
ncbi:MAG: arginase [Burkholderiaceae bacterium]|nr:arginase [Burkholderiaceae bacterium]